MADLGQRSANSLQLTALSSTAPVSSNLQHRTQSLTLIHITRC